MIVINQGVGGATASRGVGRNRVVLVSMVP